ncbi:MAG: endonuclease/exonuclease/phosphatase family protein [Bacteroidota bacterium]
MTYNLSFRTQNLETNCSVIQQADPDILLVQELTPHWSEKLQASIGANYPYQEKIVFERARGLGIYSKFRIGDSKVFRNAENKPYAQTVELYISDKIFQLINVHLASPNKALKSFTQFIPRYYKNHQTRKAQLKTLKDYAEEEAPKFDCQFWVGDFNTMKYDPLFKRLRTHWLNTFDEVGTGRGLTFPNSSRLWPLITIDYILARGKAQCLESKVLSGGDSDHLAIMTKMKI